MGTDENVARAIMVIAEFEVAAEADRNAGIKGASAYMDRFSRGLRAEEQETLRQYIYVRKRYFEEYLRITKEALT